MDNVSIIAFGLKIIFESLRPAITEIMDQLVASNHMTEESKAGQLDSMTWDYHIGRIFHGNCVSEFKKIAGQVRVYTIKELRYNFSTKQKKILYIGFGGHVIYKYDKASTKMIKGQMFGGRDDNYKSFKLDAPIKCRAIPYLHITIKGRNKIFYDLEEYDKFVEKNTKKNKKKPKKLTKEQQTLMSFLK